MARAAVLLVVFAVLAGCAQKGDDTTPAPSPTASVTPSMTQATAPSSTAPPAGNASTPGLPTLALLDCRNFGGVFPVPMDSARAALPPGFEPVASPSDPAGGATLYVLGLHCMDSTVDGATAGAADLLYAELAVVPPAGQKVPGLDDCTVPVLFASGNPAVGAALAAYRLGQAGAGEVAWAEHTGSGDVIVAADLGGASVTLRGAVASPEPATGLGDGGFAVYGVQGGAVQAVLRGHAAGGDAQDAAVTLEATGAPAPIGDARPAARGFSVGGFSLKFEDASRS